MPWFLRRSPLLTSVPLEGTDTVPGLRTLERLRMAELLHAPPEAAPPVRGGAFRAFRSFRGGGGGTAVAAPAAGDWQRCYQRYRGPFIEQLGVDELQQAPKNWDVFWKGSDKGQLAAAYNLPASIAVLRERIEENLVTFLPNYLRVAAGVLLATFYLRPRALLGAAAVLYSMYRSAAIAYRRQQQEAAAAAAAANRGVPARQTRTVAAAAAAGEGEAAADPNEQVVTAALTVVTWLLVAYTRCLPILLLGCAASLVAVLLHCALRRSPSELRLKGRQLLGFTWQQVLGREPAPPGYDPRALLRELAAEARVAAARSWRQGCRYCRYYALTAMDRVQAVFSRQ
ncbi:hypothetical protein D9Q98_003785 [Chlorella vulgaris]|uniref:PRA1 family protein n=1 Tax=Chlorella vulgaris TaxID=3077 RepID=A0A9D4TQH7_CHLVU|nr:hypothetical protein D9Q98_003785 [Chlorella vulgaris]